MDQKMKKDAGKPALELIPRECLEGMGHVLTFGAEKYDRHLWRDGMEWSRLLGGALRHINAFNDGEDLDPESGQSHLYHAMCCLAFLGTYQETGTGVDDRNIKNRNYAEVALSLAKEFEEAQRDKHSTVNLNMLDEDTLSIPLKDYTKLRDTVTGLNR